MSNFFVAKRCSDKELYEYYFCFACVWAIGGAFLNDGSITKYRDEFSSFFKSECRAVKFPTSGTVYDYFIDKSGKWAPWSDLVSPYEHDPDEIVAKSFVATTETKRVRYFLDLCTRIGKPAMLVGGAGSGKTMLALNLLDELDDNEFMFTKINFNYYTNALMLQQIMEMPLERKIRRDFGPPGTKKLIYFIDDFNMPQLDEYDTQTPHTLIRQHIDHGHWYDRAKWELRNVKNCQYLACMNPSTGTFTIDARLQRHFATFAVQMPAKESLMTMYAQILAAHLEDFRPGVAKMSEAVIAATINLHGMVANTFLPTAIKFHYQFNLRDISNIVQGLLHSQRIVLKEPIDLVQLWAHECRRNYSDVLTSDEEMVRFETFMRDSYRKSFTELRLKDEEVFVEPLLFAHFAQGIGDMTYARVSDFDALSALLYEGLEGYNELNATMDLVLFQDAMEHVCRISRIINSGEGNALLVGVGGSGKQSLSRLAAFINSFDIFQIQIKSNYGVAELKQDLVLLYQKAGIRGDDVVFLLTDTQIVDEQFLIYVNDLLSSGDIPDLYAQEDKDNIIAQIRTEVKQAGIMDTREACWQFFINKVQRHLHVVLCFSPVGETFRSRYRKFPALVNNTCIDWFHPWPHEALVSVADHFLSEVELGEEEVAKNVVLFIAECHGSVERASVIYREAYRRFNYTTPKSFLELIQLYKVMLARKRAEVRGESDRLRSGLDRLEGAAEQVAALHERLAAEKVELEERTKVTQELVAQLSLDQEKVSKEREFAEDEERKTDLVAKEVQKRQEACDEDLKKAEPALIRAMEALDTFDRDDIVFVRSLASPPKAVKKVLAAVMILQSPPGRLKRDLSWAQAKKTMKDVNMFLRSLKEFDKDNIPPENLRELERKYLKDPEFNFEVMKSKSIAAAGICTFVINICEYHKIYTVVQPKRDALAEATQQLQTAQAKLAAIQHRVESLKRNLQELTNKFEKANSDKLDMENQAKKTALTIQLADRLVAGLAGEKIRWGEEVERLKVLDSTLVGDVLAASSFISYIGAFNRELRNQLINEQWLPWLKEHNIPMSDDYDPLNILTNDAQVAKWNNEGLPTDRVSLENAAICANCERWPLIIDPQLQAITWLKNREGFEDMKATQMTEEKYLTVVTNSVEEGDACLIDNVKEEIDPMLDPILARNVTRRGAQNVIVVGGRDYEYNRNFKLFLLSKMGNPHFIPEVQAQTTLINFTVTEDGLEEQLLALVVASERPDLEKQRSELIRQQNEFAIKLKELELSLLRKLQEAEGDFLSDTALVENLETTKALADDINKKKKLAEETKESLNKIRDNYRPVAARGSLLYFLLNDLSGIDHMYQFSLSAFVHVFENAINKAQTAEELEERVRNLTDTVTFYVFSYAARGLFERHKLIFSTMLCFRILQKAESVDPVELEFLVRGTDAGDVKSPLEWCSNKMWSMATGLAKLPNFKRLTEDIEGSSSRWKKWCEELEPEDVPMPQDWKNRKSVQKLCIIRCLRPDRLINALEQFISMNPELGERYVNFTHEPITKTFEEAGPVTPLFFILSPGVDPLKDIEMLGRRRGITLENRKLVSVSLGQGQDVIAIEALERAHQEGTWVMLGNIHLMTSWLPTLEKKMDELSVGYHDDFRLFLSAEPSHHPIPIAILQRCIKVTNEPPRGMRASMLRAFDNFDEDALSASSKETEFHSILFTMCFFHAVVLERRKFGPQGWNIPYPFNTGDLTISMDVLVNYLEINSTVPWEDLRYMFGEIMYGGHISDDWDRRLCATYLEGFLNEGLLNDEPELCDGFPLPPHGNVETYRNYIDEMLPAEDPGMFGLPRNAETGFLTSQADTLFKTILSLAPAIGASGSGETREEAVQTIMAEILEGVTDDTLFNMSELYLETEDKMQDPFVVVALQECDRMNGLVFEILRSLRELDLGLRGDLMMSAAMEKLLMELYTNKVPDSWSALAYPSLKTLADWFQDLLKRIKQLQKWTSGFRVPNVLWLSGLFNPQSFLTAIMQASARKNNLPLDKMRLLTEVTKKKEEEITTARLEGAYVSGLFLEGARWDRPSGQLANAKKDLYNRMPVMYIKAVTLDKFDSKNYYQCPVYKTRRRGPTYVWDFYLRTKHPPQKWILAGAAILLTVE